MATKTSVPKEISLILNEKFYEIYYDWNGNLWTKCIHSGIFVNIQNKRVFVLFTMERSWSSKAF